MVKKDYIGLIVFVSIFSLLPLVITNEYYIGILVPSAFNCLACIGLCLLMGYAGQISLGHAGFIGLGAYISGYLTVHFGWSPWFAMFIGICGVAVIAVLVGVPALRLKGHYLAMATLGFGSILHVIAVAAIDITGGPAGLNDIPYLNLFGLSLDTEIRYYYFGWIVTALGLFLSLNLIHSRVGRGLQAIHGSEDAAGASGVNTSIYKIYIFIISAIYASVAGSLYAHYVNYIDPGPFGVMHSVLLVTMVAVGGMHSIWGAIIGSVLLSLLPEMLSFLSDYFQTFGISYNQDFDTLIYGAILLSIMLFLPEGLFAGISNLLTSSKKIFIKKDIGETKT